MTRTEHSKKPRGQADERVGSLASQYEAEERAWARAAKDPEFRAELKQVARAYDAGSRAD